MREVDVI